MKRLPWLLALSVLGFLTSCAATGETKMKPKPYNPGDELSDRAQGQGYRASHYSTPFGLPLSN